MDYLKELFFGNIIPFEHKMQMNEEDKKEMRQSMRLEEKLLASLNEQQKQLYQEYENLRMKMATKSECEFFSYGFRLGAQIALEVTKK